MGKVAEASFLWTHFGAGIDKWNKAATPKWAHAVQINNLQYINHFQQFTLREGLPYCYSQYCWITLLTTELLIYKMFI